MCSPSPWLQLPYFPYLGLDFKLNPLWSYDKGDVLTCQMWECDGGAAGCNPATPTQLPNAEAGDDLIGQATLSMGAFQVYTDSHALALTFSIQCSTCV